MSKANPLLGPDSSRSRLLTNAEVTLDLTRHLLDRVFPANRVVSIEPLLGGLVNDNFKLHLDGLNDSFVLRFYRRDPAACQKEIDIYQLVQPTVPVPEVINAEPVGHDGVAPFALLRFVEGVPFRELRRTRNLDAIAKTAYEIGRTAAAIGKYQFAEGGWFGPELEIGGKFIEGSNSVVRFCDRCLASDNFVRRAGEELVEQIHDFAWQGAAGLTWIENERSLVHSDFGSRNILVREVGGKWRVAAVIDWEFAFSGSSLLDVGNFLRYERAEQPLVEPHFSRGYVDGGGQLREDWRQLARVIDLGALCEMLTRDELPDNVERELLELIRATIENRDPPSADA